MTYATVEKKLASIPEEYLGEVSAFLDYIQYRVSFAKTAKSAPGEDSMRAVDELAGLWADHGNNAPVEDEVRRMRAGRRF